MSGFGGQLFGADLFGAGQVGGFVPTAPEIINVSPAIGPSGIALTNPVSFDLVSPDAIQAVAIAVHYRTYQEHVMIYETDAFTTPYAPGSSIAGIGGTTVSVTLFEFGGWRDRIRSIIVFGIDLAPVKFVLDVLEA